MRQAARRLAAMLNVALAPVRPAAATPMRATR
jgi:hypothetical protein